MTGHTKSAQATPSPNHDVLVPAMAENSAVRKDVEVGLNVNRTIRWEFGKFGKTTPLVGHDCIMRAYM